MKKFFVVCVLGVGALAWSGAAGGQGAGSLLVLSKKGHTLAIVDPTSLKVMAKVPVGNDPHEVIASSDGRMAFVSNYGNGRFNTLAVVDLTAAKALPEVDLGPLKGPHGLAFAGGKAWFTSEVAKAVGRYDPATQKVDWILGTGQNRIHMVWVSEDQQRLVASNVTSSTVTLAERVPAETLGPQPGNRPPGGEAGTGDGKDWNETVIPVGKGSEGFDVSPDGREIWVANAGDGTISVIDVASKKVVDTLNADAPGGNRLKFTKDGTKVLVSTLKGQLVMLDASSRKVVKRMQVGHGAAGILMEPGGARAFVACSPDNSVSVIDLKTFTVVGRIDAGEEPDGMAWAMR